MHSAIVNLFKRGKPFWAIWSFILIAAIGIVDYLTGYEISLSLFYLVPITAIAWFVSSRAGIWASAFSTIVWLVGNIAAGEVYANSFIYAWNALMRFGFFICVVLLLSALKKSWKREQALERIDLLTGAANSRYFGELAQIEIERSSRYKRPLTVAYLDLNNFKIINDKYGAAEGDAILRTLVSICKNQLRKTDVVARLGGDEFIFLLPETPQAGAEVAISSLQLALLEAIHQNNWPVTLSIGVLVCASVPQTVDEMVEIADNLMYSAKRGGKNSVCYATYIG